MSTKTILLPTDFSETSTGALPWAMDMANTLDASITCVYVVEEPHIYSTLDMGTAAIPTTGELVTSAEARAEQFVHEHLANAPHGHDSKVVVGHAATEIVNMAKETGAAMIVMSTHGYSGVKHVVMGSTTEDVVRTAPCPVLSIRGS